MKYSVSLSADLMMAGVSSMDIEICSFTMNIVRMERLKIVLTRLLLKRWL